ncbi:MAG TPA: MFS transporter [Methylocella sp.]|nr:MFS transporter [Methylocella sp.]
MREKLPQHLQNLREIPPSIVALGFVSLLMDASSETIHALLPVYLVTVFCTSMTAVGIIEGVAEATASIVKLFSGAISDWLGNRKLLAVFGYGVAALSKPIFPLAPSIAWLAAARFIDRIGKGIRGAPRDALVADLAPPHLRGASFGLRQSLDTTGAFLGPAFAIGLMWLSADNFTLVFWFAVLPASLAAALLVVAVHEPARASRHREVRLHLSLTQLKQLGSNFWLVVAAATIFSLARFSEAFLILRAETLGLPLALAPLVLIAMNIVYALSAYPAGAWSDRFGRMSVLRLGFLFLIAADLALAFPQNLAGVALGILLWGLHMGLTQGLLPALVADTARPQSRGTAYGVFNFSSGLALLAASIIAGELWDQLYPRATFLTGAGLTALALLGLAAATRRSPGLGSLDHG